MSGAEGRPAWRRLRWVALGLALLALWIAREPVMEALPRGIEAVRGAGPLGGVGFMGLYVAFTVAMLPGSWLTAAAGAIWGVGGGFVLVWPSSLLGASLAFLLARGLLRAPVGAWVKRDRRYEALDRAVAGGGAQMVGLLRLSPLIPYNLLNYALGLTGVRLRDYVLGSALGMIPGTLLYLWLGSLADELGQLAVGQGHPARLLWLGVGLGATVAVAVALARRAREALEELE